MVKYLRQVVVFSFMVIGVRAAFRRLRRTPSVSPETMPEPIASPAQIMESSIVVSTFQFWVWHGKYSDATSDDWSVFHFASQELPGNADDAIVFLNGWSLEFLDGDHHVREVETSIDSIEFERGRLSWRAYGRFRDNDTPPIKWTYNYTVVAWSHGAYDAQAERNTIFGRASSTMTQMPITSSHSELVLFDIQQRTTLVLPTGFSLRWNESTDHPLRHIGFNLSHHETVKVDQDQDVDGGAGTYRSGFTTWDTHGIFSDGSYHHFTLGHRNTTVGGPSVSSIQPPFTILPTWRTWEIGQPGGWKKTKDVEVRGLRFDQAIPVLAGWDLQYDFGRAQHVRKLGVRIESFRYTPPTPSTTGTLRYRITSELYDNDKNPGFSGHFNVHILGFTKRIPANAEFGGDVIRIADEDTVEDQALTQEAMLE